MVFSTYRFSTRGLCVAATAYLSGDPDTAEATIQGGVGGLEGSGAALSLCHFYMMLAEVAPAKGEVADATERIDTAIEASGRFGNRFMIAETHRIKARTSKRTRTKPPSTSRSKSPAASPQSPANCVRPPASPDCFRARGNPKRPKRPSPRLSSRCPAAGNSPTRSTPPRCWQN